MPRLTKYSATERQEGKKELLAQLPNDFFTYENSWWTRDEYPHEHWDDWQAYRGFNEQTIGGKFLLILTKLNIIETVAHEWRSRPSYKHSDAYALFEMLAVAPDGFIYVMHKGEVLHYKLDIPPKKPLDSSVT